MNDVLGDGDMRTAWPLTHPELRLRMTQAWVEANTNHPLLNLRYCYLPAFLPSELHAAETP
jgi:hypothetical protein